MGANAEIVKRGFAAIEHKDLDGVLADVHEDVEWRPLLSHAPGEDTFVGHAGIKRWWERAMEIFPNVEAQLEEFIESGDVVYVEGSLGTQSVPGLQPVAWVFQLRDGKVTRMEIFQDRAEARAVAGLDQ